MSEAAYQLPKAFIWRRLHSMAGFWFMLFLMEHLLVNSQAALWVGESGRGFVEMVNSIHNLPYIQVIELFFLGVPIFIHMALGVKYLFSAKFNSFPTSGKNPRLPYERNHAYTWQRITSWILLFLVIFHVVKFRFLEYPTSVQTGSQTTYMVRVSIDPGLYTVADRLKTKLYSQNDLEKLNRELGDREQEQTLVDAAKEIEHSSRAYQHYDAQTKLIVTSAKNWEERAAFIKKITGFSLKENEVVTASEDFGTATLLAVRDTFKSPIYVGLYTIFVLAACFHGFNGFWTFLITWGWILNMSSQKRMVKVAWGLIFITTFLGLAAVWGTYWVNLKT